MRRAKTGTLPKVRPAAPSERENWGATDVILDANGYNKSCKAALTAAGIKILLRDARWKNQAETTFQLQKGVY